MMSVVMPPLSNCVRAAVMAVVAISEARFDGVSAMRSPISIEGESDIVPPAALRMYIVSYP
jgi:hypothetical protein